MRRSLLTFAALAVTVAIFAVRLAPAALADTCLAQWTSGAARLSDTAGTVWAARGILTAGTARIPVAWRTDPWPLLNGELRLHLAPQGGAAAGSPRATITLRGDHLALRDVAATLPAGLLNAAPGSAAVWTLGGEFDVSTVAFDWAPPTNRGSARIRWRAARLTPPGSAAPLDLGDVSVALGAEGDRVSGPVSNVGGDLEIRGEVVLRAAGGIRVSLVLAPRRADNRELAQALSGLGAPDGDGWRVDWQSSFR